MHAWTCERMHVCMHTNTHTCPRNQAPSSVKKAARLATGRSQDKAKRSTRRQAQERMHHEATLNLSFGRRGEKETVGGTYSPHHGPRPALEFQCWPGDTKQRRKLESSPGLHNIDIRGRGGNMPGGKNKFRLRLCLSLKRGHDSRAMAIFPLVLRRQHGAEQCSNSAPEGRCAAKAFSFPAALACARRPTVCEGRHLDSALHV